MIKEAILYVNKIVKLTDKNATDEAFSLNSIDSSLPDFNFNHSSDDTLKGLLISI